MNKLQTDKRNNEAMGPLPYLYLYLATLATMTTHVKPHKTTSIVGCGRVVDIVSRVFTLLGIEIKQLFHLGKIEEYPFN